jgi:putative heme-binding domain-containing protein
LKFLEESIVKPDAYVPNSYRGIVVVLRSGSTISGIRLNEDDLSVQLRDLGGNLRSFFKEDIKEIRRDKPSVMPSYESTLNKKDLGDLVAYLNSLKGEQ